MEKTSLGFRIYKIWQILKHFAGTFHDKHKPLFSEEGITQKLSKIAV